MKKLLLLAVSLVLLAITADVARACHAIALVNPLQQPLANSTGIQVTASSDSPTCGCAVYWLDIEVRCNSASDPFTGGPLQPGVWVPYNNYPFFQSQQMQKPNCVVQQYPWVTIPFSGLCPGVTYKYRMRENHNGQAGPWTATFTFTVPGVASPLQVTASANPTSVCGTQTVQLSSTITGGCSSNQIITWSPSTGLSSSTVANPTATVSSNTTYTVTYQDLCSNQTASASVTITVSPPPVAGTASISPSSICVGQTTTLTLTGYSANSTIQWQSSSSASGPWANIGGANTTPYTASPVSTTYYQAVVSNACGSVTSNVVSVTVTPAPIMTATASPSTICPGGTSTLAATGAPNCTWQPGNLTGTSVTVTPSATTTYTVTGTTATGCTGTATVTVTVSSPAATASASPATICAGATSALTATGITGCTWQPGNLNGTSVTVTPSATTTYTVTGTTPTGCTSTATVTVTVDPVPVMSATASPATVCSGSPSTLTATGSPNCTWQPGNLTGTSVTVTPSATTTYTVTGTTAAGCQGTATVTVTVNLAITVTASASPSIICAGSPTTLTMTGAPNGTWQPGNITGTTVTVSPTATTTYTVTGTTPSGCQGTATVTVTVTSPTTLITSQTNVLCNGGSTGTATVNASGGNSPYQYSWNTNPVQTTQTATGLIAGAYVVTVTDANNCNATASVTITEPAQLTASITASTNVSCFGGSNGAATVTGAGGTGSYSYSWSSTPAQSTQTAANLPAGSYTVTITDQNNCSTTATVTITEPAQLTLSAAGFDATCNAACDGQVVVIPSGGTQPYTYSWSPGGCSTPSCNSLCAGTYSVTVTDANGCTATASATVNEPPALVLTTFSTSSHCNQPDGSAWVTVTGGTPVYSYLWSSSASATNDTAFALVPGPYSVTVTDFNNCVATATVSVGNTPGVVATLTGSTNATCNASCDGTATVSATGGNGPYTFLWNDPAAQTTATALNLCAGNYSVTVTDSNGCTSTVTVTITEPAPVVATPNTPAAICIGQCVTLTSGASGGTGPYTYTWSSGANVCPISTTVYTVTATDANGCTSAPASVTVTVNPPLNVVATGSSGICPNGTAQLGATGSGGNGGPYTYTWLPAAGLSSSNVQNPTASPSVNTTYTVYVTDQCGTPVDSDMVTITINPLPFVIINSDIVAACDTPGCINFTDASTIASGTITAWSWDFGDGVNTSTQQNPSLCYGGPGTYNVTLTVTSDLGCQATVGAPYPITIYPEPVADFTFGPQPATMVNPEICFTDASAYADTWSWDFGDPSDITTSSIQNPCHFYQDSGTYCVDLIVTTTHGCNDTITHCVVIGPDFVLYVPNAFSPNDDNVNDNFLAQGIGVDETNFQLYIFDRWGNMIFYTEDYTKGWNGHANYGNKVAQQDVYVWKIVVKDIMGSKHQYMGHVTLVK